LDRQQHAPHPVTGARPGGWASTDYPGGVPEVMATCDALIALAALARGNPQRRERSMPAATSALRWLVEMQNEDGGWPNFNSGWLASHRDRSATDTTAAALRAIAAWRNALVTDGFTSLERQNLDA